MNIVFMMSMLSARDTTWSCKTTDTSLLHFGLNHLYFKTNAAWAILLGVCYKQLSCRKAWASRGFSEQNSF